jgi:archaellum component FlaC
MAISAALEKAMPALMDRLPQLIANLPPDVVGTIGQIGKSVATFQASIDRVEHNQRRIMLHLGIITPDEIIPADKVLENGRSAEQRE